MNPGLSSPGPFDLDANSTGFGAAPVTGISSSQSYRNESLNGVNSPGTKQKKRGSGGTWDRAYIASRDLGGARICRGNHLSFSRYFGFLLSPRRIPEVGQVEGCRLRFHRQGIALLAEQQPVKQRGDNVIIRVHNVW